MTIPTNPPRFLQANVVFARCIFWLLIPPLGFQMATGGDAIAATAQSAHPSVHPSVHPSAGQQSARQRLNEVRRAHLQVLVEMEKQANARDDVAAARSARTFQLTFDRGRQTICPIVVDDQTAARGTAANDNSLTEKIEAVNRKHAARLFEIAAGLDHALDSALAFQLLHEILVFDREHPQARRMLGFKKTSKGKWYRPARNIVARKSTTKQSTTGWKARTYTTVDSAHYRISTTADAESAVLLAEKLDRWHNIWQQVFFDYWVKPGTIERWFAGKSSVKISSKKHRVIFFKDRAEYLAMMQKLGVTGAEHSTGNYNDKIKTIFFYAGASDPDVRITWLHEQAHQLFQETGVTRKGATDRQGFWLVEAVAMYMESLAERSGNRNFVTLGGFDAQRLQYARIRANRQGFYLPLGKLVELGRAEFQRDQNVRSLYSQSAGLAHFFMNAADGQFRQPFVRLIGISYQGRGRSDSLSELTGISYDDLDKQYRKFLVPDPRDLASLSNPSTQKELALGGSPVTNEQLKSISECVQLEWLQLSGTRIDDRASETVAQLQQLDQLFVDSTNVTDKFVAGIAGLKQLTELDLARTRITDQSLEQIGRWTRLKALYLTGTAITDGGLAKLSNLTELEYLDVRGTRISPAALKQLKSQLPKLK